MAAHPGDPRPHVVSQRPDLQRLRHREPETEAGTHVELPELRWTRWDDRNLNAAINLRNLIMPAGRSRDGPGQEAMGQQGCRLRAKVIPAAFPSGKTGHISGAMDVNLEWTRISDDRRPQAWKRGSPEPNHG